VTYGGRWAAPTSKRATAGRGLGLGLGDVLVLVSWALGQQFETRDWGD
jgi:hypothetical protein